MFRVYLFLTLLFLTSAVINAQNYTISGYVKDSETGETLIGSSVFDAIGMKGTSTNNFGFYSITLPKGEKELRGSYISYKDFSLKFDLTKDTIINIFLTPDNLLEGVVVSANKQELGVRGSQISAIDVPVEQLKLIPALLGESDIIKALQLLPGVQSGTEGFSGFYVRGGGPDENLFLLDGVPVYNVNHLGGFFSVFNADAIKNVTLYKGGFPARFGGRLSSVLDIQMKDGNNKQIHGNINIGILSAKFNIEGPLTKSGKTTFNISGRRTYYDIIAQPIMAIIAATQEDVDKLKAGYYFYDLNLKLSHTFSDRDKLYLSFYSGDDVVYANIRSNYATSNNYNSEERMMLDWNWGNLITALRWNHLIGNKLFMNTTATYTQYRFDMVVGQKFTATQKDPPMEAYELAEVGYNSGISDYSIKVDFDYSPNPNHDVKFGANYTYHQFRPGVSVAKYHIKDNQDKMDFDTTFGDKNIYSQETMLYVEDNMSIGSFLKANVGLHHSTYYVDKKHYQSLQPRLSARALISDKVSLKIGYAMMKQYIHLLSNNNISLPTDLWVPVTKRIEPMISHQYSLGVFYTFRNLIDFSVEAYYKTMDNLIEYKDGASFMGSTTGWEDKVSMGRGWAYGVEFLAQKNIGKTTGWIGYTWAKTERLFNRPGQEINNGNVFPAKYDRRHDISVVFSHKFNDRIDISATWVYSTGNTATLGLQEYPEMQHQNNDYWWAYPLTHIDHRNNYRYPDYHRLDLGINFHKKLRRGTRTWNISCYNIYNQKNPFFVYPAETGYYNHFTEQWEYSKNLEQVTIFPILPSFSYSFTF